MQSDKVLALYDFASKQRYIYRTSKIREISGASTLLTERFGRFIDLICDKVGRLRKALDEPFRMAAFDADQSIIGEVIYDGGGSLMVLYKSREYYLAANRVISLDLLETVPGLSMIASCVPFTGNFSADKKALYAENSRRKNFYPDFELPTVIPMTQIDPATFSPVVRKVTRPELASLSADRAAKLRAYKADKSNNLDELEGLTAVIYIDGNAMGDKLKRCDDSSYDRGVEKLRSFSRQVDECFVQKPLAAIKEAVQGGGFRKVIGGGDEITVICKAELAWDILCAYYDALDKCRLRLPGSGPDGEACTACAGIAVFHAKTPFDLTDAIAEAACENAKKRAHREDNCCCVDFYYCHTGVTNSFDFLRDYEQAHTTGRPYRFDEAKVQFSKYAPLLNAAGRANVKALGESAQESFERYQFEVRRVNAYLGKDREFKTNDREEMKIVYDMSEFYDIWFAKKGGTPNAAAQDHT